MHETMVGSLNHADFVKAFVLQLGANEQHSRILELLAACGRGFVGQKIAYKPPHGVQLTSILAVAIWVFFFNTILNRDENPANGHRTRSWHRHKTPTPLLRHTRTISALLQTQTPTPNPNHPHSPANSRFQPTPRWLPNDASESNR